MGLGRCYKDGAMWHIKAMATAANRRAVTTTIVGLRLVLPRAMISVTLGCKSGAKLLSDCAVVSKRVVSRNHG